MIYLAFTRDGTGDAGDSVHHYLYAKEAFKHPDNFFNHWAKPLFVMMAAPFAQFGFVGIKLFNIFWATTALILIYPCAKILGITRAWIPQIFLATMPFNIVLVLSGLTEPMFAGWLLISLYFFLNNKSSAGSILLSFLPFIRSEGLVVIIPLLVYMILEKRWKPIALIAVGHIVMTFAGLYFHKDLFWTVTKIPYPTIDHYGKGTWDHFFNEISAVVGHINIYFFRAGLIYGLYFLYKYFSSKLKDFSQVIWLVYAVFVGFFMAHVIFWRFGLFNSFGLTRVMICVLPQAALIAAFPLDKVLGFFEGKSILQWTLSSVICIGLPIYGVFKKINFDASFNKMETQKLDDEIAKKYKDHYKNNDYVLYWDGVYPNVPFDIDRFDKSKFRTGEKLYSEPLPIKSMYIWDDWFSPMEAGVSLQKIKEDSRFVLKDIFTTHDFNENRIRYRYLFETKQNGVSKNIWKAISFLEDSTENRKTILQKPCILLNKSNAYSPMLEFTLNADTIEGELCSIEAKLNFYSDRCNIPEWDCTKLVIVSENDKGEQIEWKGVALEALSKTSEWNELTVNTMIKRNSKSETRIKVMVWVPSDNTVFTDGLKIKVGQ